MNFYKQILSVFFAFLISTTISNADVVDVTNKFNDLILNNDPLDRHNPYKPHNAQNQYNPHKPHNYYNQHNP